MEIFIAAFRGYDEDIRNHNFWCQNFRVAIASIGMSKKIVGLFYADTVRYLDLRWMLGISFFISRLTFIFSMLGNPL